VIVVGSVRPRAFGNTKDQITKVQPGQIGIRRYDSSGHGTGGRVAISIQFTRPGVH
jgi:hypothetical protein